MSNDTLGIPKCCNFALASAKYAFHPILHFVLCPMSTVHHTRSHISSHCIPWEEMDGLGSYRQRVPLYLLSIPSYCTMGWNALYLLSISSHCTMEGNGWTVHQNLFSTDNCNYRISSNRCRPQIVAAQSKDLDGHHASARTVCVA